MSDSKEVIQARLLSNIDNTYDKTEGSFFYDAEKPVAIELESAYAEQNEILNKGFVDTATDTFLERITSVYGIYRKLATKSTTTVTITGTIGALITIGDKVASDLVNFTFTEDKVIDATGIVTVIVECATAGTIGNVPIGAIKYFPITLAGLVSVTNTVAVTNGYETETDVELQQRYYDKVRNPATSGNKAQYLIWAKEVTGVGDAKIFALFYGKGTVKVTIINSNKRAADTELINNVAAHIEEVRPIGVTVSVVSATEKAIDISVTLSIDTNNYTLEGITTAIEVALTEYFKTIAFITTYVSYARIGNLIFDIPGVLDYSNLLVNTGTANIDITDEEIAVLGGAVVG